jgi:hypothetical protein
VEGALEANTTQRHDRWSESIAVGSKRFVEQIKTELGIKVNPSVAILD